MLGFDSYSKSIIGSIVEQRIRLFLTKRKIINIPVFKTVSKSDNVTIGLIGEKLFEFFKAETGDLFYYYAFSSILLNTPDYNFLINDDAESLKKAEKNLRDMFDKILQDFFEGGSADQNNQVDNSNLFNFIKDPKYQREIPAFGATLTFDQLQTQNVGNAPLYADVLEVDGNNKITTNGKEKKLISEMQQPFYVDFFYRNKKGDLYFQKYVGEGDGIGSGDNTAFPIKDYNRGARLMFNLTSGITQPTDSTDFVGKDNNKFNYYPLKPSKFLPFFLPQTGKTSQSKFVKDYPLPFLSTNVPIKAGQNSKGVVKTTNRPTSNESPVYGPTFLYGVVRKIQNGNTANKLKENSVHWITDTKYVNNSESLDKHYFYALKSEGAYPGFNNWNELMWSKSLVCFDWSPAYSLIPAKMYAYFPIIIAEYVSESGEDDNTIINKLLETEEVKLFSNLIKKEISEQPTSLVQIIIDNETVSSGKSNISLLFENTTIKIQEEKLDNMLLKLINFDEET